MEQNRARAICADRTPMNDRQQPYSAILAGMRLLIVEDEFIVTLDIERVLESAGVAEIVSAGRVADALQALDEGSNFDLALVDLKLERDSALPVVERLAALAIPFVILTGSPDTAETRSFPRAPVVGKPFDDATLMAALELALSSAPPGRDGG
jgi:CheY-like chemotaxis protein